MTKSSHPSVDSYFDLKGRLSDWQKSVEDKIIKETINESFIKWLLEYSTMPDIATLIEESSAIKHGKFKLSNGMLSDYYIDKYVFETDPSILAVISREIADRLSENEIDVVAGPELGAVPIVTAVSLETGISAAYVRKGEKHYGTQARIEGTIEKGKRVAIVEDVTTTGGTIIETANIVKEIGGIPERLIVVVDRNEGAVDNVIEAGYELEYLVQVGDDFQIN